MSFDLLKYLDAPDTGLHSVIGASSAERWMACPASVRLSEGVEKAPTSKYAWEGTRAHRLAECILTDKIESWECVGLVPREMIDGADMYANHVRSLAKEKLSTIWVEKEFHLPDLDDRAFGTADAVVVTLRDLHVIDFKYGAGVAVDVSESQDASGLGGEESELATNPQLLFYALGALREAKDYPIKTVHIWVVQPRAVHSDGPIRHGAISVEALEKWAVGLKQAMLETRSPTAKIEKGKHCRWCPALRVCPEQGKLTVGNATHDFAEPHVNLPAANAMSEKQIGLILEQQPIVETWFKSVREHAYSKLSAGHMIPGFKLVSGRSSRSWVDEVKAEKFLKAKLGEDAFSRKIISVSQAEKKTEVPDHLINVSAGPPVITVETDKRKPFKPTPTEDFE